MMKFPLPDGGVFAVIEPGNIERLKAGRPLQVGDCLVCFTPDMQRFAEQLGLNGDLPQKGEQREHHVRLTPEQIEDALKACQNLPEVQR